MSRAGTTARSLPVLTAVLLSVVVALTGCSSPSQSGSPAGAVPSAAPPPSTQALATVARAVATTSTMTAGFDLNFSGVPVGSQSATPRDASGVVDFRSPAATIRLDLPSASGGSERMVFLPDTVFINPPASSPPLQAGRPWIFANFADIAKYKVNFPPYIVQTESVNPAFVLYELAWGATSAAPLGSTTFDGRPAEAYLVTVNLVQAISHSSGAAADVFGRALTSEVGAFGGSSPTAPPTMRVEAWVDSAHRLIGARHTPPGAGIGTLTLSVTQFGTVVHADKPPRSKVVDIAAMIPGGEQEALNGGDSDGA